MDKFNRNFSLEVQTQAGTTLLITPPFTLQFDITRNSLISLNESTIRIFNLSPKNRNLIRKDRTDYGDQRNLILRAGYGTNLPIIFKGNITQAWSVRESVDFITTIQSFDGGFAAANAIMNSQFPAGTSQITILETAIKSLPGVSVGAIGAFPGSIPRANAYTGSTMGFLNEQTNGGFFIDNGRGFVLSDSECIEGELKVLSSASGLLGTPVREQAFLNFEVLFEPRLVVGQRIKLDSITGSNFNSEYKVISVKHQGMISESVCGEAITSVGVFAPQLLTVVQAQNGG